MSARHWEFWFPQGEKGEGEWLVWAMSLAVPDCNDLCGEGGIPFREVGSIFPASKGISSPLASGAMSVGLLGSYLQGDAPNCQAL